MSTRDIEKAIQHALDLKEKGVAEQTILAVFPEERNYIRAVFGFTGALKTKREELDPSIEIFEDVLRDLPALPREEGVPEVSIIETAIQAAPISESHLSLILWALAGLVALGVIIAFIVWG